MHKPKKPSPYASHVVDIQLRSEQNFNNIAMDNGESFIENNQNRQQILDEILAAKNKNPLDEKNQNPHDASNNGR